MAKFKLFFRAVLYGCLALLQTINLIISIMTKTGLVAIFMVGVTVGVALYLCYDNYRLAQRERYLRHQQRRLQDLQASLDEITHHLPATPDLIDEEWPEGDGEVITKNSPILLEADLKSVVVAHFNGEGGIRPRN